MRDAGRMAPHRSRRARRRIGAALALYPLALVGLTLLALAVPQREGALALAQVFAHFLFLPALLLIPLAFARGMFLLRLALAAAAATFLLVYPPALRLAPAEPFAEPRLTVLSWNIYVGGVGDVQLREALAEHEPDVALLQEVIWDEVAADPEIAARYPYRLLRPDEAAPGLALLSRHPIIEAGVPDLPGEQWDMPRVMWARLQVGERTVTVVNGHPIPPRTFEEGCSVLRCYNSGPRDAQIAQLRAFVEELRRQTGDPLILGGDMNVTEREQAYFDLSAGLTDAHRAAGQGFGTTWRPGPIQWVGGLIRIDYLFGAAGAEPVDLFTDCARRGSDHCLLVGRFALSGGA